MIPQPRSPAVSNKIIKRRLVFNSRQLQSVMKNCRERAARWLCLAASLTLVVSVPVQATSIVEELYFGFQMPGTVVDIDLEPPVPEPGEPFSIQITGVTSEFCPPLNYREPSLFRRTLRIGSDRKICAEGPDGGQECRYDTECRVEGPPVTFSQEFSVDAGFWDEVEPERFSGEPEANQPVHVLFYVEFGAAPINADPPVLRDKTAAWQRSFDLQRGTHTIPPRLGSGFWVSEEQPNEGLLIQQQGDQVVFYELAYGPERTAQSNFAGTWLYADLKFSGDSGNGVSAKVARPDLSAPDVVFEEKLSSSIIVDDVNHVRALFDAGPGETADFITYTAYRRWSFNRDTENLPAVMPDFSGGWTVQRFDGATELERFSLSFDNGAWLDTDRWRFNALDDDASLICKVNNLGDGTCRLEFADSAEVMSFEIADFNGNLASGVFNSGGAVTDEAVFLRQPFELPVAQ